MAHSIRRHETADGKVVWSGIVEFGGGIGPATNTRVYFYETRRAALAGCISDKIGEHGRLSEETLDIITWPAPEGEKRIMSDQTQADHVAQIMGDDGQRWTAPDGRPLKQVCADMGARFEPYDEEATADGPGWWVRFPDGSCIVVTLGGWDVACPECGVWQEAGEHREGCSRA